MDWPFQLYGNAAGQSVTDSSSDSARLMTKCSVAIESQTVVAVRVAVSSQAPVMDCPFQLYGNAAGQSVTVSSPVTAGLITKCNVAIESQPSVAVSVAV